MDYGKDEGAGSWVKTNDGTTTVSEYMIARHKEWCERVINGDGGLPDAAMFALEMQKMLKAFGEILPSYQRLRQNADRQYDDGDLAG